MLVVSHHTVSLRLKPSAAPRSAKVVDLKHNAPVEELEASSSFSRFRFVGDLEQIPSLKLT